MIHYSGVRNQQNSTGVLFSYPMLIHARASCLPRTEAGTRPARTEAGTRPARDAQPPVPRAVPPRSPRARSSVGRRHKNTARESGKPKLSAQRTNSGSGARPRKDTLRKTHGTQPSRERVRSGAPSNPQTQDPRPKTQVPSPKSQAPAPAPAPAERGSGSFRGSGRRARRSRRSRVRHTSLADALAVVRLPFWSVRIPRLSLV